MSPINLSFNYVTLKDNYVTFGFRVSFTAGHYSCGQIGKFNNWFTNEGGGGMQLPHAVYKRLKQDYDATNVSVRLRHRTGMVAIHLSDEEMVVIKLKGESDVLNNIRHVFAKVMLRSIRIVMDAT